MTSRKVISLDEERSLGRIVIFPNCWTRKRRSDPSGGMARATGSLIFWFWKVGVILTRGAPRREAAERRNDRSCFIGEE